MGAKLVIKFMELHTSSRSPPKKIVEKYVYCSSESELEGTGIRDWHARRCLKKKSISA